MYELVRSGNAITDLLLQTTIPRLPEAHIGESRLHRVSRIYLFASFTSMPATFDTYALFTDMYNNPGRYLNGTGPANVTGCILSCVMQLDESGTDSLTCTNVEGEGLRDGYLWCVLCLRGFLETNADKSVDPNGACICRFNELHPSQQADRIVAREITAVLKGEQSKWMTWWS